MRGTKPEETTALLLVAGVGRRLGRDTPKVLLEFGGKTLLERHVAALHASGIERIVLTVGHGEDAIRQEVERLGLGGALQFVRNARYREGSLISLWQQRTLLQSGTPILLMDGDVLYGPGMIARLLAAPGENVLLVDRAIEAGDEPVKVCFKDGRLVDFGKMPQFAYDSLGESVGFFRFSPEMASALADRCQARLQKGDAKAEYEEAIRDLILVYPNRFSAADVSDLPWTEIDFASDVVRASEAILPKLEP